MAAKKTARTKRMRDQDSSEATRRKQHRLHGTFKDAGLDPVKDRGKIIQRAWRFPAHVAMSVAARALEEKRTVQDLVAHLITAYTNDEDARTGSVEHECNFTPVDLVSQYVSQREAADFLEKKIGDAHYRQIRSSCSDGTLPCARFGPATLIRKSDLLNWASKFS